MSYFQQLKGLKTRTQKMTKMSFRKYYVEMLNNLFALKFEHFPKDK